MTQDTGIWLAMVGDCVVGAGDSADDAMADARERDGDVEQAGTLVARLIPSWMRYEMGSVIDWGQRPR